MASRREGKTSDPFLSRAVAATWLTLGLLLAACGRAPAAPASAAELRLFDTTGAPVRPFEATDAKALLFIFVRTDCPISNRYAPEIQALSKTYAPRGVSLWLVYPDPAESGELVREHAEQYAFEVGLLRDPSLELVRLVGATVTPEAAVFLPDGSLVYRGRIDDRNADFGKIRVAATEHDLADALDAVLAGQPVPKPRTRAVGCYISGL